MAEKVDSIFKRAKEGKPLFVDRKVLTPEYVPDKLPFREKQLNGVAEVLAPVLHGSKPSNLLLYGKTGTGKTAVAKYVLGRLQAETSDSTLAVSYVNTRIAGTEYKTLAEFALSLGLSRKEILFTGLSIGELISRIFERIQSGGRHVIFVIDEIDYLVKTHGDARRAVDLLRIAGEVGEREGLQTIDDTCVRKASDKMEHDRIDEAVRSLPLQNKVILLAVSRFIGGTNTGEVYLAYSSIVKKTATELLTQRRVSGILAELDLLGLVEAAVVSKGRRGRTKRIRLLLEPETLHKILGEDPALAGLF